MDPTLLAVISFGGNVALKTLPSLFNDTSVESQIKMCFEDSLKVWSPNKGTRVSKRKGLLEGIQELIENPDNHHKSTDKTLDILKFYQLFEQNLIVNYPTVHNYLRIMHDRKEKKSSETTKRKLFFGPLLPNYHIKRTTDFNSLKEKLLNPNNKAVGITGTAQKAIGVNGLGGVGKSMIAAAIAHDKDVQKNFVDGIYWVTINKNPTDEQIHEKLTKLHGEVFRESVTGYPNDFLFTELKHYFETKKILLVIDDIWDIKDLYHFRFINSDSKMLMTSRIKDTLNAVDADILELDVLSPEQSLQILRNKKIQFEENSEKEKLAKELLKQTGYLALAVNIIASMIKGKRIEWWVEVLQNFKDSKTKNIKYKTENKLHENLFDLVGVSFEYLNNDQRLAFNKLALFPENYKMSFNTLKVYFGKVSFINKLVNDSLLIDNGDNTYSLHDLIFDFVKINTKGNIHFFKKKFLVNYFNYYEGQWEELPYNDYFFINNFIDYANEKKIHLIEQAKQVASEVLYRNPSLNKRFVIKAINILNANKNDVALQLLWLNKNDDTLMWIISILGMKNTDILDFAEKYIDHGYLNFKVTPKCLDILLYNDSQNKEVYIEKAFTFARTFIDSEHLDKNTNITEKCLNILLKTKEDHDLAQALDFARKYVASDDLNKNSHLTTKCLDVLLQGDEKDIEQATSFVKDYLIYKENNHFDTQITLKCISVLKTTDGQVLDFVRKYIDLENQNKDSTITEKCLNILLDTHQEHDKRQVITFARKYIDPQSLNENSIITEKCLNILFKSQDTEDITKILEFAVAYIQPKNLTKNSNVIEKCLDILFKAEDDDYKTQAIDFARQYVASENVSKKSNITNKCLDILLKNDTEEDENIALQFANTHLKKIEQNNLRYSILDFKCFRILGNSNQKVVAFCRFYLFQKPKKHYQGIVNCIKIFGYDSPIAIEYSETIICEKREYFHKLHKKVQTEVLLIESKNSNRQTIAKYILNQYNVNRTYRGIIYASMVALLDTRFNLEPVYNLLLGNWQSQIIHVIKGEIHYYDLHIRVAIERTTNEMLRTKVIRGIKTSIAEEGIKYSNSLLELIGYEE